MSTRVCTKSAESHVELGDLLRRVASTYTVNTRLLLPLLELLVESHTPAQCLSQFFYDVLFQSWSVAVSFSNLVLEVILEKSS